MERVLKRVGLSRRTLSTSEAASKPDDDKSEQRRRRRRSKSRRRVAEANTTTTSSTTTKTTSKTRGLFNIDWDSVRECRACKSRALTKRFCSKKCDNELYRSNSFKFERFVRDDGNEEDGGGGGGGRDVSTLGKKIALCEDYSLPVDHLSKRRPNSIAAPSASDWNISSPNEDKVEVLETYSTPRDSKQRLSQEVEDVDQKCFTSPDREYSQPYTTDASSDPSSDEEFFGHNITLTRVPQVELNSPDSIAEGTIQAGVASASNVQSPVRTDIKRHPSPYYYSDLLKPRVVEQSQPPQFQFQPQQQFANQQQQIHFQQQLLLPHESAFAFSKPGVRAIVGGERHSQTNPEKKKHHHNHCKSSTGYHKKYRKSTSLDNASNSGEKRVKHAHRVKDAYLAAAAACEMSRQRHLYETAFDCRVSRSDDDLDEVDRVSNHSVLSQLEHHAPPLQPAASSVTLESRRKAAAYHATHAKSVDADDGAISRLSQKLEGACTIAALPLRGYTPSPPSTAPLPTKFHGKDGGLLNSIRSAPNLPSHSKSRLRSNLHLPIKALPTSTNSAFDMSRPANKFAEDKETRILEIKDRPPRKDLLLFKRAKDGKGGTILEFKARRRRHKYSSTESMTTTTSSSGGSMESIKSSTSEGNRSTTSTESRNSSSLSSHDSDSGAVGNYLATQSSFHAQNKLHILSPISDKSSQEPVSEISDNNRNNNSQKCSPELQELHIHPITETTKSRRRLPQNKNLLNLGLHTGDPEMQGSDSGISIQSREGVKLRIGLTMELTAPNQCDFSDLPFDMPKLRRRRLVAAQEAACTSSSATSIDFGDLPFDMPKLRRRLRVQQASKELSVSEASSSQSVVDPEAQGLNFRPKLSLNLPSDANTVKAKPKPELGLSLTGLGFNTVKSPTRTHNLIDINLPLEKQGWYHGAITRVEAENVLRALREGSFLVRNSESTKQDYSLSLKSARGFMHMRIQRDESTGTRSFILGQFSKPFTSIPEMIRHFSLNGLPIRGAEHMCLIQPVIVQLL